MAEIDGELAALLQQVRWASLNDQFVDDLKKAIERYGQLRWSEGYDDGLREE